MTVAEFKSAHNIQAINFYKSKTTDRLVASVMINGVECRVISRSDFDPSGEKHIYHNNILADADGVIVENLYWLSNSSGEVALTL